MQMIPSYDSVVRVLIDKKIMTEQLIYRYHDDPLISVSESLYGFATVHLYEKSLMWGDKVPYVVFAQCDEINAFAKGTERAKIIGFCKGLIQKMHAFFSRQDTLFEREEFKSMNDVVAHLGDPVWKSLYEFLFIFIYYHEYAHILQGQNFSSFDFSEKPGPVISGVVALRSHAVEMDADWVAGVLIRGHIKALFVQADWRVQVSQKVNDIMAIIYAAIFCFFIKTAEGKLELYFDKHKHPHPYIRIQYISASITRNARTLFPAFAKFNSQQAVLKALQLSEAMLQSEFEQPTRHFVNEYQTRLDDISKHIEKVVDIAMGMKNLCRHLPPELLQD